MNDEVKDKVVSVHRSAFIVLLFAPRLLGPFTMLVCTGLTPTASSLHAVTWLLFPFNVFELELG
jgi:hypothetical protein